MRALACFLTVAIFCLDAARASDLPAVTVEHLYYLRSRGLRLQEFKADEVVDYCLAMKIGGPAFDTVYAQVLWMRTELVKTTKVDMIPASDPYVRWLNKSLEAYVAFLREEAMRVQSGLVKEGTVAFDTLEAISRAQNPPQK